MRMLSTVLAICVSVAACAAVVSPTLPEPDWPDSEAATNAALPVATWQKRGHFDVQMSVAAGTNLVQLAFGCDADGDGDTNLMDVSRIQMSFANPNAVNVADRVAVDIDRNKQVEIIDATYLQRWLNQIEIPYEIIIKG